MAQLTMEQRLAALEGEVARLRAELERVNKPDWRTAVGMFTGDEVMKRIDEEGRKIREADRRKTRPRLKKKRKQVSP